MRCASSIPAMVIVASSNDLKPAIEAQWRLIARWSCSTILLRYLQLLPRRGSGALRDWHLGKKDLNRFWCKCGHANDRILDSAVDKLKRAPDPIAPSATGHGAVGRHQMRTAVS